MQVKSNKIKDIRDFYLNRLKNIFPGAEAAKLLEIVFADLLGITRTEILIKPDFRLSESELLTIHFAVKDLLKHRPIQHITGKTEFFGLNIQVNENVLIPRPETEELVEWILKDEQHKPEMKVLDIGTGSGAIALALKNERPAWEVWTLENSEKALETARNNASDNDLQMHFIHADILDKKTLKNLPEFDVIVSNPPYVTELDKLQMQANVLDFEPPEALYVPDIDPLKFYRAILSFAAHHLLRKGNLYFEINERFGNEIQHLLREEGYKNIELRKDLNNRHRMIRCTANA